MSHGLDRRRFLEGLLASSAAAAGAGLLLPGCSREPAAAVAMFPDPEAVRRIGGLHRSAGLDRSQRAELEQRIEAAAAAPGPAETRWQALAQDLHRRVERDFADGRVVEVEGWRLSQTEILVCAVLTA